MSCKDCLCTTLVPNSIKVHCELEDTYSSELVISLKKYFTPFCLMGQHTCHLISSVLELLLIDLLLVLTGYNYLRI
jgi:hypothetical protein